MNLLPFSRPLTRADLDALPDDGRKHELIHGCLLLSPTAGTVHQRVIGHLLVQLHAAGPPDFMTLPGPLDVVLAEDTVLRPDLLVVRWTDFAGRDLPGLPLLAVEVLSPSTRWIDPTVKRSLLEAAGCASYWVVDPDTPSLIAWELRDGAYTQVAKVVGDQEARLTSPYDVTVVPANLIL